MEFLFNAVALAGALWMQRQNLFKGQCFHIYLMAYGGFRFFHEFMRDTPRLLGPISGYQIAALVVALSGLMGFWQRRGKDCCAG